MDSQDKTGRADPTVYVLELAGGKFYVGKSNDVSRRYDEHLRGQGSEWTKIHEVLSIVETREGASEDTVVLEYMKMKGIENVRGGAFSQIDISAHVSTIESLIRSRDDACFKCGKVGHFAADCIVVSAVSSWLAANKRVIHDKVRNEVLSAITDHFIDEMRQKSGFGTTAGKMIYAAVSDAFEVEFAAAKKSEDRIRAGACAAVMRETIGKIVESKAKKMYAAPANTSSQAVAGSATAGECVQVAASALSTTSELSTPSASSTALSSAVVQPPASTSAPTQVHPRYETKCLRCGRNNHTAEKCFAKTRIDGAQI